MRFTPKALSFDDAFPRHPFDDDKLHEECGVFGVIGVGRGCKFHSPWTARLAASRARGGRDRQPIIPTGGFASARRFGYVRDNFTKQSLMETLPGPLSIGHVRYSTAGSKGNTQIRDVQPFFGEFSMGGAAIAPQRQYHQC